MQQQRTAAGSRQILKQLDENTLRMKNFVAGNYFAKVVWICLNSLVAMTFCPAWLGWIMSGWFSFGRSYRFNS
jgi:hypothetical protein